jgi:Pentapeptide repeats (9 copies)
VEETAPPDWREPHPLPSWGPAREEFQVRQTAQRLLADHLRCPPETSGQDAQVLPPSPRQAFWPGISLNLTGGTLVDFDFTRVSVMEALFDRVAFYGDADFSNAAFHGEASFWEAAFHANASFHYAVFHSLIQFDRAVFHGMVDFAGAAFRDSRFYNAVFHSSARFTGVTFHHSAIFDRVAFHGEADFHEAAFSGFVTFYGVTFRGGVTFDHAVVDVHQLTTLDTAGVTGSRVAHVGDLIFNHFWEWPDGWTVRPDPTDPSRGTLVPAEDANQPEPTVPPPDPTDSGSGTG